jgi:hypothetical protein
MVEFSALLIFLASSLCGYSQMSISKVSYLVGKKQDDKTGRLKRYTFYQVRKDLFNKYPEILTGKIDTVYFMEKYEVEEGSIFGIIWTKKDTVNYYFCKNEINLSDRKFFTRKAMSLISAWDTALIRNEDKFYGGSRIVYAERAIITGSKCVVDTIHTRDFIFER